MGAVDKKRVKTAVVRGQEGEDWVMDALREAFPTINGCQGGNSIDFKTSQKSNLKSRCV